MPLNPLLLEFLSGFTAGTRSFLPALRQLLSLVPLVMALFLLGTGLVLVAHELGQPFDVIADMGKISMLAGGAVLVAGCLRAWWLVIATVARGESKK